MSLSDDIIPQFSGDYAKRYTLDAAASQLMYKGATVCKNTSGNAEKGSADATLVTVGVAEAQCDNSTGLAGDKEVLVHSGVYKRGNYASDLITDDDVGLPCYVYDDFQVARTSSSGTRPAAGIIVQVDDDGVRVWMSPEASALAAAYAGAAAGVALQKRTVTVAETDLTASATTQTLNIGATLPANARIVGVDMRSYTPFTGGSVSAMKIDVGTSGDVDALIAQADAFATAVDGGPASMPAGVRPNKTFVSGGAQLTAKFTATGDNVVSCTAGAITIDVLFSVLA